MSEPGAELLRVEGLRTWFPIHAGLLRRIRGFVKAVDGGWQCVRNSKINL